MSRWAPGSCRGLMRMLYTQNCRKDLDLACARSCACSGEQDELLLGGGGVAAAGLASGLLSRRTRLHPRGSFVLAMHARLP